MKVAIVGADGRYWRPEDVPFVKALIRYILKAMDADVLISGRCPLGGVDVWAEEVADEMGLEKLIFPPEGRGWRYYHERNLKIARECDVIFDIEPEDRRGNSGGAWTARQAAKMGKLAIKVIVGNGYVTFKRMKAT